MKNLSIGIEKDNFLFGSFKSRKTEIPIEGHVAIKTVDNSVVLSHSLKNFPPKEYFEAMNEISLT